MGKKQTNAAEEDGRFKEISRDPRFKVPKKKSQRVEIDARFKTALKTDERFKSKAKLDKYGRKIKKKAAKEELADLYDLSDKESSSESEEELQPKSRVSLLERMRGEVADSEESSFESDSDDDEEPQLEETVDEYDLGRSNVQTGDESHRLAVVNMDWDNISATDLMVAFQGFVPKGHKIESIKIYPSEFGKKQMALEELEGPARNTMKENEENNVLKGRKTEATDNDQEFDQDEDYSSRRLRKYQLQRLQYYYAVVDCDSVAGAAAIYDNCDGTEYESTANFFDLRFVPDDVTFDDKPTDECTSVPANYKPNEFITDALQHSKVKLTWDETPKERARFAEKAFNKAEMDDNDLKAYLASDSDSDDMKASADKYRSLLGRDEQDAEPADESDGDVDMEITFNPVLEGGKAKIEITDDAKSSVNLEDENLTTVEKYRLKEKERRLKRKEKYKARKADEADKIEELPEEKEKEKRGKYKLTKTAEKRRAQAEQERNFDTSDPRFSALFEDPDFAIDSTAPQFKKTGAMDKVLEERRRRRGDEEPIPQKKHKAESKKDSVNQIVASLRKKQKN